MKEATGELNASVIVVIAVSLLAAFFFMVVWPRVKGDLQTSSKCSAAICNKGYNAEGMSTCKISGESTTFECPYRG